MHFLIAVIWLSCLLVSCEKKDPTLKNPGSKVALETAQEAWENEYYRFQINPLEVEWKIIDSEQASGLSADASGGALHVSGTQCLVIVEPVGTMDIDDYAVLLRDNMLAAIAGSEAEDIVESAYLGLSCRDVTFRGLVSGIDMIYVMRCLFLQVIGALSEIRFLQFGVLDLH